MSTKIIFRRGNLVPVTEVLSVGEPLWDVKNSKLGVGNGEQQPRWLPKIDANNNLILNPATGIYSSNYDSKSNKNSYLTYSGKTLQFWSNGVLSASFDDTGGTLIAALTAASLTINGSVSLPGFTILQDGTIKITGSLQILGGLNLSLSQFAASVLPTLFNNGDILVAGIPHNWKNPAVLLSGTIFAGVLGKISGIYQSIKLDFINSAYWAITTGMTATLNNRFMDFIVSNPSVTFTRNSTSTFFNKKGILTVALPNTSRHDHDPYTGEPLGIKIEGASTNYVLNSSDLSPWIYTGMTFINASRSLWDARNLGRTNTIAETSVTGEHSFSQNISNLMDNAYCTWSTFIELDANPVRSSIALTVEDSTGNNKFGSHFDLSSMNAGNPITIGNGSLFKTTTRRIAGNIYRISVTGIVNTVNGRGSTILTVKIAGTSAINGSIIYSGLGGIIGYIGCFQVEMYDKPSSFIPTTIFPVSRAADFLSIPTAIFDYDDLVGTFTVAFRLNKSFSANAPIVLASSADISTNHELKVSASSTLELTVRSGGSPAFYNSFSISPYTSTRISWQYLQYGTALSTKDGVATSPVSINLLPLGINSIILGSNPNTTSSLDGWISSFSYVNKKTQAITL